MDKQLQAYYTTMIQTVKQVSLEERLQLRAYHYQRVAEFQHERQIHLLVTFFFGGLMLVAYVGLAAAMVLADSLLVWLTVLLVVILTILELAYIGHYFRLENGTQKLYEITNLLQ